MLNEKLPARAVKIPLTSSDKISIIEELTQLLCDVYSIDSSAEIFDSVLEREEMMSTGVGYGLAIPHAKVDKISIPKIVAGISEKGVYFDSIDHRPARIFFLLVSPKNDCGEHVRILSELSRIMNNPRVREEILTAQTSAQFVDILGKFEG
ncbi:PTS sugar transporter subunit IIA [bacterium]|nr:PTS sugar transporter subunit IIA [bacterium]